FIPHRTVAGFMSLPGLVMFGLYAAGILSALGVSFVTRRFLWRGAVEPFLMELPTYKLPDAENVARNLLLRAKIFILRAGRIIFPLMIVIWFLSSFPGAPAGATDPAINYSIAGRLGHLLQPLLAPIGFNWQMTVALIPGFAAREVAVAALGTVYAIGSADAAPGALATTLTHHWSVATGLSFLAWYVFAPQCASTLGVVKRETNSWRWPLVMLVYMTAMAYVASLIVYRAAVAAGLG
ncbi:MAG: Iron transporter FeoB, partial [Phenylobacterium sp.]|nr:Iron transporter FeoB [Phenylobacterium sp.]